MIILGAGMAGCLAGIVNPSATILEASEEPPINHKAVLRFRTDAIANVTGIPFKKVKVQKAIWCDGFVPPSPRMSNYYSQKVLGIITSRSIDNLDTVYRYVAPPDFQEKLIALCGNRIYYDHPVGEITKQMIGVTGQADIYRADHSIVSTMPMPVLARIIGHPIPASKAHDDFHFQPIFTSRYTIPNCDVFQTIYYTSPGLPIYRATLTSDALIIESVGESQPGHHLEVFASFGIDPNIPIPVEQNYSQKYGKIADINEFIRRTFIHNATMNLNIYSLGRFATWRNILLDDVLDDINVIRRLENADVYSHLLETK